MEPGSFANLSAFINGEEQESECGDTFIGQPSTPMKDSHGLSRQELTCLRYASGGLSNKLIGNEMHISAFTVKFHLRNALAKLGHSTRTGAVAYAIRNGIIK